MTDQELDRIMRRVLIDSMKVEAERDKDEPVPPFQATPKHQRQMRAMLANPIKWLHRRERPVWKQVAQRIAVFFLTFALIFGGIMAVSPSARAAVVRWVVEWYENTINFLYAGEQNSEAMPQYEITELPEGYVEVERNTAPGWADVIYENAQKEVICLSYVFMHQGALSGFETENADAFETQVNSYKGIYFESNMPDGLSTLTWIDTDRNLQFMIDGPCQYDELLPVAESVSLCKTPN